MLAPEAPPSAGAEVDAPWSCAVDKATWTFRHIELKDAKGGYCRATIYPPYPKAACRFNGEQVGGPSGDVILGTDRLQGQFPENTRFTICEQEVLCGCANAPNPNGSNR